MRDAGFGIRDGDASSAGEELRKARNARKGCWAFCSSSAAGNYAQPGGQLAEYLEAAKRQILERRERGKKVWSIFGKVWGVALLIG